MATGGGSAPGPLLLGGAVATFFNGSNFLIDKGNITNSLQPVISRWANASHGLDALLDPWNVVLGLAVLMLARILGMLSRLRRNWCCRTMGTRQRRLHRR